MAKVPMIDTMVAQIVYEPGGNAYEVARTIVTITRLHAKYIECSSWDKPRFVRVFGTAGQTRTLLIYTLRFIEGALKG